MTDHEKKVARICKFLKERKSTAPLSLKKKTVSHEVPKPQDKKYSDERLDVGDLNKIISIDPEKMICVAEPGVTFFELSKATIEHGLVPTTVPEHKAITIGGAVAGCSVESMSFKYGGFHDSCIEYEVITAKGDVINCSPGKDNLLFQMMHGTFGTLGIISKLTFKLVPAKRFVKVDNKKYDNLKDYMAEIYDHYVKKDIDFMDGIIYSPTEYVLCVANFVDKAPYTHNYDWTRVYYIHAKNKKEDYLKTVDYFFRYDKGTTRAQIKTYLGRLFFGKLAGSTTVLKIVEKFHKFISPERIPITVDVFIPFSKINEFMEWYNREFNHFPLWCVPYKIGHKYEWASDKFYDKTKDEFFIDLAIYGMKRENHEEYYRKLEKELMEIGAIKTLISNNFYTEDEFWNTWNKDNYYKVKKMTDPDNIFRDLYEKTCKAMRGLGR